MEQLDWTKDLGLYLKALGMHVTQHRVTHGLQHTLRAVRWTRSHQGPAGHKERALEYEGGRHFHFSK